MREILRHLCRLFTPQRYDLTLSRAAGRWFVAIGENPAGREKSPAATAKL
ncbi:hypothetical protein AB0P36_29895 [Streptomyces flavidovirens]